MHIDLNAEQYFAALEAITFARDYHADGYPEHEKYFQKILEHFEDAQEEKILLTDNNSVNYLPMSMIQLALGGLVEVLWAIKNELSEMKEKM